MPYFRAFQPFRSRRPTLWTQSLSWWIIWFLISTFLYAIVQIGLFVTTFLSSTALTMGTNAVFSGFSAFSVTATNFMNSITFVMNYLFFISSDFSDFASLSDPQTLPFFFKRVPPWFYLRRRLLYPFNYENKCRIFKLFSLFRLRWPSLWTQSLLWWIIYFLILTFLYATVQIELLVTAFSYLTALTMVMS